MLVKEVEGISWRDALAKVEVPDPFNVEDAIPRRRDDRRPARPTENPLPPFLIPVTAQRFPTYLRRRGFGLRDVAPFGLQFANSGELRGHVVFPYWDFHGRYRSWRSRIMSLEQKQFLGPEEAITANLLYGVWRLASLQTLDRIFIVEGPFDVIRFWSYGLPTVGLGTTAMSAAQENQVVELARQFGAVIYVLLDRGASEWGAAEVIAATLLGRGARALPFSLPEGVKDPDLLPREQAQELLDKCYEVELSSSLRTGTGGE